MKSAPWLLLVIVLVGVGAATIQKTPDKKAVSNDN